MTPEQAKTLYNGVYTLVWTKGGKSIAAVGRGADGAAWFAPVNWIAGMPSTSWHFVREARPIRLAGPDDGAESETRTGANDRQVGGDHYKTGGEEHWDRVARLRLDYFQGQITKYVERWKRKNGIEDLKKARHFLDKYIELAEAGLLADKEKPNEP